ncbi:NAD(P)-binding protein [Mycena olivaceomarginata]|nr:NAD(P)-binding protein [Mycena olivaceomarginata]
MKSRTLASLALPVISLLLYRQFTSMPSLSIARTFNAAFSPSYTPTAIFVGGTSGIGQGMAEAFARHTKGNANIFLVGRNRAAGEAILHTFPQPTVPGVTHEFNVHRVAGELRTRIPKVNFLVLTAGVMTMNGRNETEEGMIESWRCIIMDDGAFINDLLSAVEDARKAGEDAKVMTVLSAGKGGKIDLDDLGLKKTFSLPNAAAAGSTYNDLMVVVTLAKRHPGLTFVHSYPGFVSTNLLKASDTRFMRLSNTFLMPLFSPFAYSGEDIGLQKGYVGSEEAMERLWKHTEEATRV